ncbi:zinc-finger of the MIZ type in Nse subunit-domain-containing protein [Endogone sp. FLAS-F59071]|nr:zinc-finger of the MIZ type in Nse subunit-domain-containing protein [Endogone sp. FLAS-F59071]|eukprot:RUS21921.1 zinc-finger of the MIZ type in Nse subunit-domain-containing protein [Endogone sp. FLAS-F59071]
MPVVASSSRAPPPPLPPPEIGDIAENPLENFCVESTHAVKINPLIDDFDKILRTIAHGIQHSTEVASDLEEVKESGQVDRIESSVRTYIDLENQLKIQKQCMEELRTRIQSGEKIKNIVAEYQAMVGHGTEKYANQPDAAKYFENETFVEFKQKIILFINWSIIRPTYASICQCYVASLARRQIPSYPFRQDVHHPNEVMPSLIPRPTDDSEDDIVIGSQRVSLKCPITQTLLVNPVTSKICKHSFSGAAVTDMINRQGGKIRCPESGCEKILTLNDLAPNKGLARKVKRAKDTWQDQEDEDMDKYVEVE